MLVDMEPVQDAMKDRRQHQRRDADQQEAGKNGIERSEDLAAVGQQRVERAHAGKDHRGVGKGVDGSHVLEVNVTAGAHHQRHGHDRRRRNGVAGEPADEHVLAHCVGVCRGVAQSARLTFANR